MNNVHTLRRRMSRRGLAALAVALPALALASCGGEDNVPGNAVAKVDDQNIEKATFDHWLRIAAIAQQGPTSGAQAPQPQIPEPPEFTACVAELKKTSPKPPKGQPKPTDEQFKAQCKQQYEGLRDQVMQLLIQNEWVEGEAEEQGIKVTDDEVRKAFEEQKKQSFPKKGDYEKFLKSSGFTEQDILFRVRLEQLSNKLREKVVKGKDQVNEEQIKSYYDKNKKRFAQPERRDLRVVLTKTEERANEAKAALEDGQSWKTVAKRFSIDQMSKNQGGTLRGVAEGQQEPTLDKAVFAAERGQLQGPIKTQFGYYVFQVQKVTPATQQTLDQARETIKGIVSSENQQKALDTFIKEFREKWKSKTQCREGYIMADCDNFQEPKTTSTAPPGAVPGQPPVPQGAPPGGAPTPTPQEQPPG